MTGSFREALPRSIPPPAMVRLFKVAFSLREKVGAGRDEEFPENDVVWRANRLAERVGHFETLSVVFRETSWQRLLKRMAPLRVAAKRC